MQKDRAGFLVGFLLAFSGCLSANFTPTSGNLYQPRPSDCDIEVFSSGPPDRAYVEVGVVEGKGTAWKAEFRDLLPAIMEEGCRAGGDGIIIGSMDMSAEGADNVPTQVIQATVIRWTD